MRHVLTNMYRCATIDPSHDRTRPPSPPARLPGVPRRPRRGLRPLPRRADAPEPRRPRRDRPAPGVSPCSSCPARSTSAGSAPPPAPLQAIQDASHIPARVPAAAQARRLGRPGRPRPPRQCRGTRPPRPPPLLLRDAPRRAVVGDHRRRLGRDDAAVAAGVLSRRGASDRTDRERAPLPTEQVVAPWPVVPRRFPHRKCGGTARAQRLRRWLRARLRQLPEPVDQLTEHLLRQRMSSVN